MTKKFELEDLSDVLGKLDEIEAEKKARQLGYSKTYAQSHKGKEANRKAHGKRAKNNAYKASRAWIKAHPEKQRQYTSVHTVRWMKENAKHVRDYAKAHYRQKMLAMTPKQLANFKAERKAKWAAWYAKNKEHVAQRYKDRKKHEQDV